MPQELPAPFGKYELLELIGSGGMADVFLARSFGVAGFEKRLVIKRIKAEHAQDPRFVQSFIQEAKVGTLLNHPNIVAVHELGKVGDAWYIAMEFLHGRDLNKVVRALRAAGTRMDPEDAVRILAEVCRGLAFAHSGAGTSPATSLVHRDVSPHNVFLTFAGEVKLVDFGIARLLGGAEPTDTPAAAQAGGKVAYMSPEQASGLPVGPASDQFSAGVVLWELLVGQKLHGGSEVEDKRERVIAADIPDPRKLGAAVDDALWGILKRALAPRPEDRHETVGALEDELRAWLYERRAKLGRTALTELMHDLFPASDKNPAVVDLHRLADDLSRIGREEESSQPSAGSHDAPRPAPTTTRLQPAEGERKRVVAVAIDVDGFTSISIEEEPEVLFRRHLQLLRWLHEVIDAHGGVVHASHDDRLLVLFGSQRTRADDVERALDATLALQRKVGELHDRGLAVQLAIGVHVGDVTVGRAGTKVRVTGRGDTLRLPVRIAEHADHAQTLVSQAVFTHADGAFEFKRGPWVPRRGRGMPWATWLLGKRSTTPRALRTGPWLRRGDELDTIRVALAQVAEGRGASVLLLGEPGSGKSRLIHEFSELALRRGIPVATGSCSAFGSPHAVIRGALLSLVGLHAHAPDADIRDRAPRFRQLGLVPLDVVTVDALLGLRPPPDEGPDPWSVLRRVLTALASGGPRVLVIDDAHQLPSREQAGLASLVARLADVPVLVLVSMADARPDGLETTSEIRLGPLGASVEARFVARLMSAESVGPMLQALVARSCEGNPLYIEELVKFLVDRGDIVVDDGVARLRTGADTGVPGSLLGLLAARVDALDPAAKGVLQIAAVFGDEVSTPLLGEVVGMDDALPIVDVLVARGLLRTLDGGRVAFASAPIREAVQRGILGVQRRDHHRLIAEALERRRKAGDDVDLSGLAAHLGFAGRWLDAARTAYTAAQAHEREQALETARELYRRGLRWLAEVESTPETYDARTQGEAMLRLRLGVVSLLLGDNPGGLSALRVALDISEDAGLPWLEVQAHLELGRHHLDAREVARARAHLQQAHTLARRERDATIEVEVLEARARLALLDGATAEAEALWADVSQRASTDPALRARCLAGLAHARLQSGDHDAPRPWLDEALALAQKAGDAILEGRVLNNLGMLHVLRDEPEDAARMFRRALEVRERVGYAHGVVVNHHNLGSVHFQLGDMALAHVSFARSREVAEDLGWVRGVALNDVYLAFIDGLHGATDVISRIEDAIDVLRRVGDDETAITGQWLIARTLQRLGRRGEAEVLLLEARAEAERRGLVPMIRRLDRARDVGDASD